MQPPGRALKTLNRGLNESPSEKEGKSVRNVLQAALDFKPQ